MQARPFQSNRKMYQIAVLTIRCMSMYFYKVRKDKPRNPYGRGRFSTVNLLLKMACYVKNNNNDVSINSN